MSWAMSGLTIADVRDSSDDDAQHWAINEAITAHIDAQKANGSMQYDSGAVCQQIDAAAKAAASLLNSGALGDGPWTLTLSGHANPDHKPAPGWANDAVTIAAYQAPRTA